MNNKTNTEEDIKFAKKYMQDYFYEEIAIEDDFKFEKAIENILVHIERLEKENLKLKTEIAENVYFGSMPLDQMRKLQSKANNYDSLVEKMKEKLEKLNKEEQELQDSISDEEREEYSDASIGYALSYIENQREILQELLNTEKE